MNEQERSLAERIRSRRRKQRMLPALVLCALLVLGFTVNAMTREAVTLEWAAQDEIHRELPQETAQRPDESEAPEAPDASAEADGEDATPSSDDAQETEKTPFFSTPEEAAQAGYADVRRVDRLICGHLSFDDPEHTHTVDCVETVYLPVDWEAQAAGEAEALPMPAAEWEAALGGLTVRVFAPEGALPQGAELRLADPEAEQEPESEALLALNDIETPAGYEAAARFTLSFALEGEAVEAAAPYAVTLTGNAITNAESVALARRADEGWVWLVPPTEATEEAEAGDSASADAAPESDNATEAAEDAPAGEQADEAVSATETNTEEGVGTPAAAEKTEDESNTNEDGKDAAPQAALTFEAQEAAAYALFVRSAQAQGTQPVLPAQTFAAELDGIAVTVEAPEGAFPEGAQLTLAAVETDALLPLLAEAVDERIIGVEALDIAFYLGEERIQPLLPVQVTMESDTIRAMESPVVVHVDDAGEATILSAGQDDGAEEDAPIDDETAPETEAEQNGDADAGEPALQAPLRAPMAMSDRMDALTLSAEAMETAAEVPPAEETERQAQPGGPVVFTAEAFSVYAVVETTIETRLLASDGHLYRITVTYGPEAGIPEGAELAVREIVPERSGEASHKEVEPETGDAEDAASAEETEAPAHAADASEADTEEERALSEYERYILKAKQVLDDHEEVLFARFFDICIMSGDQEAQPNAPVRVMIELADELTEDVLAVHFEQETVDGALVETPVILEAEMSQAVQWASAVAFDTDSFSVYGVVTAEPFSTVTDISQLDQHSFYLSIDHENGRYYFEDHLASNAYIAKTNANDIGSAGLYTFEKVEGTDNQFYVSIQNDEGEKVYLNATTTNNGTFSFSKDEKMPFIVEPNTEEGTFYIYNIRANNNKAAWWLNTGSTGFSTNASAPQARNQVVLTYPLSNDPLGLDGKSYGILNNQNTVSGTAMLTGAASNNTRLSGRTMTVRTEPIKRTENVFVAANSDITMWTFHYVEGDQYYITASVNGTLKYLRIDGSSVKLVDASEIDAYCRISVEPGTGIYTGKYKFSSNGSSLFLNGSTFTRGNDSTSTPNANYWMNLAELSNLKDDDFVVYTAEKVSVSGAVNDDGSIDYDVQDGDQVIIYTRIWNENTLKYDYYAIDYDGMLVRAYESGDTISWVGSKVNTMLWDFTEYHNDDGTPNYYYELQNAYSGKYIAPQVSGTGFLSDSTIGINLNGRRNGEYYSTILAWDDPYYDYASLKAQDYQLTSAPISKADTFYFAVMKPAETEDQLTTVATIDSEPFGITLKMQNYGNVGSNNRSQEQTDVLQNLTYNQWNGVKNLLTKYIADGDYPKSTLTGRSLEELYSNAMTVNNQFLLSTYKETGYFEYDSTQNFAHLITSEDDKWYGEPSPSGGTYDVGDFVIYEQIASTTESSGDTRRHGQFFPYNDLTEGSFITNYVNDTDIHGNPLSSLDPRKGEKLYRLQYRNVANSDPAYVDFFFGMEMNASFMQSESGLDAWGHDLIFEFSGDDDFWLYIDDVLVLDLGGIHSALDGSVNFRTGKVIENGKASNLRERFETAYKAQYPDKTQDEVNEWLNGIFKDDGSNTGTVFKDYSGHTMKMYYMERGAGASNLHMRFNLAPYRDGEVQLQKEVSGVESVDDEMVFPFQIRYKDKNRPDNGYVDVTSENRVVDAQTGDPIPYVETYKIDGLEYQHVFLLKPGQTASISLPDENTEYDIVECGIDTTIYDEVTANQEKLEGTATTVENHRDYPVGSATVEARKKVIYNNHVSEDAQNSLTITKKLWRESDKQNEIKAEEDDTGFRFRVYIGKSGENYTVYNTGKYYVKNPEGEYCIYRDGVFVSTGKTVFSQLSTELVSDIWKTEQEQATFYTSPGGAVDKIPAGYTVEIPGLMNGTAFWVEERSNEIPAGYYLIDYTRDLVPEGETANQGVINEHDAQVFVHNQHGYGLTVNKVWSDADFMENHDEIYVAVYLEDELLTGSVRQLGKTQTTYNWFIPELKEGKTLNDYVVYEVTLTKDKFEVDENGVVMLQEGCVVTRIKEGGMLTVGGETSEHGYSANYVYTASYSREELTEEQIESQVNNRTDTISNARPGIKLLKTDLEGKPLEGAKFTLVKANDETTKKTFTSNEEGLIAVAYLTTGEEYTLTEAAPPYRYLSLIESLRIKVDTDGNLWVNDSKEDDGSGCYTVYQVPNPTATDMPKVTIRNKPFTLKAVKKDAATGNEIAGVTFALHREVIDYYTGDPMPDYAPMEGFEELITGADGVIPRINLDDLSVGSYYLRETGTPNDYQMLPYDVRLSIATDGTIAVEKAEYSASKKKWVFSPITDGKAQAIRDQDGNVAIEIRNTPAKGVRILKKAVDQNGVALAGAEFSLYGVGQVENDQPKTGEIPLFTGTTDVNGLLNLGALATNTSFYLFETKAPNGYNSLTSPVLIMHVSSPSDKITASLNGSPLDVQTATVTVGSETIDIWQITVYNTSGVVLPSTGGPGTLPYTLVGCLLIALAVAGIIGARKRRE